jgi:hypothetical protein
VTGPAALDEIVASRNRLVDQRQKAADAVSSTLRTIGMGLAAVTYSFVFASTPSAVLASQKIALFCASALGATSVFADILQSFSERRSAQGTLEFLRDCRNRDYTPTPREIETERSLRGGRLAFGLLILRFFLCFFGAFFLMIGIARTL